jgi:hypothetical protein
MTELMGFDTAAYRSIHGLRGFLAIDQSIAGLIHLPSRGPVNLNISPVRFFREPSVKITESMV